MFYPLWFRMGSVFKRAAVIIIIESAYQMSKAIIGGIDDGKRRK